MKTEITYDEAKKAKEVLLEYLDINPDNIDLTRGRKDVVVYLALTQEYFLD